MTRSPSQPWPLAVAACLAALVSGCAGEGEPVARRQSPIVNGADDRREVFEVGDGDVRSRIERSVVALLPRSAIESDVYSVKVVAPSLQEAAGLCDGERFAAQPAAAFCSGVLVDWDLVLTAGHCVRLLALADLVAVFGYHYDAAGRLAVRPADVLGVREIVAERLDPLGAAPRIDYAWIRLERAAPAPRRPSPVRTARAALGDGLPLTVAGAGGGTPVKVDSGAKVVDARAASADYFIASSDTSHGSSGGPAFDQAAAALVGVLARGASDFEPTSAGCNASTHVEDPSGSEEQFTYAGEAVAGLCEADPAASSICSPSCGDPCDAGAQPPGGGGCTVSGGAPSLPASLVGLVGLVVVWRARRSRRRGV